MTRHSDRPVEAGSPGGRAGKEDFFYVNSQIFMIYFPGHQNPQNGLEKEECGWIPKSRGQMQHFFLFLSSHEHGFWHVLHLTLAQRTNLFCESVYPSELPRSFCRNIWLKKITLKWPCFSFYFSENWSFLQRCKCSSLWDTLLPLYLGVCKPKNKSQDFVLRNNSDAAKKKCKKERMSWYFRKK